MRLLIRADASSRMGSGHTMRCLALGQAWQEAGGTVEFLTRCDNSALLDRLSEEGMIVSRITAETDWQNLENSIRVGLPPAALVLDGYHFDTDYQQRARGLCQPLLVIDDIAHLPFYCADILLNQNINAAELSYARAPGTKLLLGCRFVLLRREFRKWRGRQRTVPARPRNLLVTLGGSDPENITARVIEAIKLSSYSSHLHTVIAAGSANPHLPSLETALHEMPGTELLFHVQDMPSLLAQADVAITAAGSTCYETAFLGLPSMTVVAASNQERTARGLQQAGITINLGWHEALSPERIAAQLDGLLMAQAKRQSMSEAGQQLIDANGADTVVALIRERSQHSRVDFGGTAAPGAARPHL